MGLIDGLLEAFSGESPQDPKQGVHEKDALPIIPSNQVGGIVAAVREATRTDAFELKIVKDHTPQLTESKLGGLPYWPHDMEYPTPVPEGLSPDERLALLAQLDLADFGGDPRLPDHGLLQFFVTTDDLNGLEFDVPMDAQRHFRVVWHEHVDPTVTAEDVAARGIAAVDGEIFPVEGEHALAVKKVSCWMTPADARFDAAFRDACVAQLGDSFFGGAPDPDSSWWNYLSDDDADALPDLLSDGNHCQNLVLGYPFFTQYDPRGEAELAHFDTLLLQLDSDYEQIMWGDSGVGNFFINGEELAAGDFGRVLYNWDCC